MMYNKILELKPRHDGEAQLLQLINNSQVFDVSNVAEYWWRSEIIGWNFGDFPNLAPPFEYCYYEYVCPDIANTDSELLKFYLRPQMRIGAFFDAKENSAGWDYAIGLFIGTSEVARILEIMVNFRVDKSGKFSGAKTPNTFFIQYASFLRDDFGLVDDDIKQAAALYLSPILMAISFLHCKNVKTVPRGHGTSPGRRNRKSPKFRYRVLEINPMKQILKVEGQSEKTGLKRALHICRGHFKDYTERGLFGRNKGIYWWDSSVRGSVDSGLVLKDYKIMPKMD